MYVEVFLDTIWLHVHLSLAVRPQQSVLLIQEIIWWGYYPNPPLLTKYISTICNIYINNLQAFHIQVRQIVYFPFQRYHHTIYFALSEYMKVITLSY